MKKSRITHKVGVAGDATDPVNLDGAAGVGIGHVCSQLGVLSTIEVGIVRTLDRAIGIDLTNHGADGRGGPDRIALVARAIDGNLVDITVGGHESRKKEREKEESEHDER